MENIVCSSSDGTLTSNIQESQRTKKSMSDGGVLPLSISKKPFKIFSQTLSSTYAGSLQSGKEDIVIIKDGTKMQNTSVSGVERGNISVFQNEKETMAPGTEDHVKKKSSDDDIVIISHKIVPRRISPGAAERLKNEAKKLHQERYKKRVSRVPDLSACNDTTAKAAMCLPVQHKSHHSRNNTGLSSSICQNTVIYNNTTTFSSEDIKIITNSEISKPENKQKILLNTVKAVTIREVVLEDPSILLKNTSQDVRLISGKSSACNSTTTGKNEIPQAATSGKRNKSALSSGHKLTLSRPKSSQKKNEKEGIVPTRTNLNNIKNNRQSGLYFEHSVGSPSKMLAGEIETNKDNSVIKPSENSVSQCVISCSLSHMEKERNAQSELEENISFKQPNISICELSAVLQKKPWLKVSRSKQECNTNSSSDFIALKPAANMNQEKPRRPTHVLNVTDTFTTLITEKESVTLPSDVCNTVLSHKEANTVKGPIAECEPHSSKGCLSLCMRGDSVKCNFSKSIEVPSTSTSDKQTAVLYSDSSLERRKTTQNEASPPPDTKVKLTVDQLHKYIAALFMDVKSNENEPCSHSSDKEIETNLTSTINNASVHSPDVMSESRRVTTSVSVTCKGGESATHDQSVHGLLLCSGFRSEGKEAGISPEVKRKKKSSCTSTNGTVSSSGSSVACIGSTSATHKQSSTALCHAQEDVMEPVITITESETTHPQSENFKLSQEISKHPSKFSLTKHNSFEILMAGQKTPQKRSPTKKLSKSSPIRYMINNRSPHSGRYRTTSPNKPDVNRTLKFGSCNTETKSGSLPSTEPKNQSSVSEFSFSKEYVSYFEAIIAEVLKDRDMLCLISEEELKIVTSFWKLETQVKKLYIRMLSRKYTWHRVSDIKYEDINVPAAFIELEVLGLVMSDYNSEELEVLLYMLKVPELRSLCRTFRIPSTMQPKPKLIQVLLEYGKSQQIMSGNKRGDSISIIKSRLREVLGHCIKVCAEGREVFHHILLLFSLPHQNDEEDRESSKQLLLLHYVKTRRVEFPTYVVLKTRPIFSSREDLIRFEKATDLLIDLMKALTTKSWDEARVYGQFAREHFRTVLEDSAGNLY
ncbi:hypothetical protein B7P43_G12121 [Cryptotermes secundus]|uniref:Fanconi-associated nuclease n=1 Tax=Cryptotermes secundus TaxID=105785 RepID=A0A2J7PE74_9NEOP|nr:hypothetical protein B7P43_G12121 [Cryptotermes secundus]